LCGVYKPFQFSLHKTRTLSKYFALVGAAPVTVRKRKCEQWILLIEIRDIEMYTLAESDGENAESKFGFEASRVYVMKPEVVRNTGDVLAEVCVDAGGVGNGEAMLSRRK
jgi:hypothetical protein